MKQTLLSFQNCLKKKAFFLEKMVTAVTLIYPLTAIPQIIEIWYYHNVSGVSFLTWFLFLILIIPLILYAITKQEWKLAIMWGTWIIVYMIILIGIIVYS